MKLFKILMLLIAGAFASSNAAGQSNASINVLTQNGGIVNQGGSVFVQVTINSTGPTVGISTFRVRAQISVPSAIVTVAPNAQQTGLPPGWTIAANTGGAITVCNATDPIPVGESRTILIRILGNTVGGPSTVTGSLTFGNGTANGCNLLTGNGSLTGDNPGDNTSSSSVQVIPAPNCSLTSVSASAGMIACNGGTTTLTATPTGATGAVEYSLTGVAPFQASNIFTVAAGVYTVTAREVSSPTCTATSTAVSVTEPSAIAAPVVGSITQPTCTSVTGTVDLSGLPAGNWTINPGVISGSTATTTISGLAAGTYNFTVTNSAGCTSAASANVVINAQPATPAIPTVGTITQPTCAVPSGSVVLNGLPSGNWTINPGAISGNTPTTTINGLAPGTYNFTVTNSTGCVSAASPNVVINDVAGAPISPTINVLHPTCTAATGTIIVTSSISGLTFSLDGGAYAAYPAGGYTVAAGSHTLMAQDVNGCISAPTNITVNAQPATPTAPAVNVVQPNCAVSTGTIIVTSETTGLAFSLNGGVYSVYPAIGYEVAAGTYTLIAQNTAGCISAVTNIIVNAQPATPAAPIVGAITHPTCTVATGSVMLSGLPSGSWTISPGAISGSTATTTINNLDPGTYNFTVTILGGCISAASADVIVNDITGAPAAPTVSIVQPTCAIATGTITITSSTTGLIFSLDGGSYAPYPPGGYIVATGDHTLTAQNGCNSPVTHITVNAQPATPTVPTITIIQPTCVVSTGSVILGDLPLGNWTINPGGITGNTATTTITGLAQGTYNFTVTNSAGCTSAASADVLINAQPATPAAPAINIIQPSCTIATGTITITSPTVGLTFSLDGGAYTAYPSSGYIVAAGSHTLTAQNADGCISAVTSITTNVQPASPTAPTFNIEQPTCTVATGTITVTSSTTGLTFSVDGGAYTAYPAGGYILAAGSHTLTAQNADGCISTVTNITVNTQPVSPTASVSAGTIICNGGTTTLNATATSGTAPFQYSLNGGAFQSGNTFTVGAGTYTVAVRDTNLCVGTAAGATITQPTAITASTSTGIISCNGGIIMLTVAATGGTGILQYSLNGGPFQANNGFTVSAGTYTATVRDANLCTTTAASVTVTQPATLTASAIADRITQCGGTAQVTVSVSGGTSPYTGAGVFTRGPGGWTFVVTDAGGCNDTATAAIEAPGCMDLKVYPNPAKNSITVNHSVAATASTMQVFSISGALVISKPVSQNTFQTTVDVDKLASGSYVVVFVNGNERKQILFQKINSY